MPQVLFEVAEGADDLSDSAGREQDQAAHDLEQLSGSPETMKEEHQPKSPKQSKNSEEGKRSKEHDSSSMEQPVAIRDDLDSEEDNAGSDKSSAEVK